MTEKTVTFGFHMGHVVMLVASRYPRLREVILEIIQNALDASATRAELVINLKKRRVTSRDNGNGVTREEFEKALTSVGKSVKEKRPRRDGLQPMGQFGLGLIAPVGKCEQYRFISRSAREKTNYIEYVFDSLSMQDSDKIDRIPCNARLDLKPGDEWWNTFIVLQKLVADKTITDIDLETLVADISDKYGQAMVKSGLELTIEFTDRTGTTEKTTVKPKEFEGQRLETVKYQTKAAGEVVFDIFLRDKPAPPTKVRLLFNVAGDAFQMPWRQIGRQADGLLDRMDVFNSGLFEGRITVQKCRVNVERVGFVNDDRFTELLIALDAWANEIGADLVEDQKVADREVRYQDVGRRALKVLDEMVRKNPTWFDAALVQLRGGITSGHSEPIRGKELEGKTIGSQHRQPQTPPAEKTCDNPRGEVDRTHTSVKGPKGHPRTAVKSQPGYTLDFDFLTGNPDRYEIDMDRGMFTVNIRHPDFTACERTDSALTRYVELLVIVGLSKLSVPESVRDAAEIAEKRMLPALVFQITQGDRLAGRRGGGRRKATD